MDREITQFLPEVMRGRLVLFVWLSTLVCVAELVASGPAHCGYVVGTAAHQRFPRAGQPIRRFGAFAAGVGSAEQGTLDLNASLLTPRLNPGSQGYAAAYLLPRLQFGGALNLAGMTSFAYADIALTLPIVKTVLRTLSRRRHPQRQSDTYTCAVRSRLPSAQLAFPLAWLLPSIGAL